MTNTTWDTDETSRIIMNDEGLYNLAMELSSRSCTTTGLALMMDDEFTEIIEAYPYSDIDLGNVNWQEIAAEIMEV